MAAPGFSFVSTAAGCVLGWHAVAVTDTGYADRWRGALLGTALGDAVGAPFEGRTWVASADVDRWLSARGPLEWTDDTAMTIGLAESLIARGGRVDPQHLGDTFAAAFRAEPWRGYGAGPPAVFAAVSRGMSYLEAAAGLFGGSGSFGNGAAMRAAPAGLLGLPSFADVADVARSQALVTHSHPLAQDGAAAVAMVVAALSSDAVSDVSATVAGLLGHLETDEMRDRIEVAIRLAAAIADDPAALVREVGHGIAAVEAVPAAVAVFLATPEDPVAVVRRAVTLGGDTDTIAAMAGALAGAHAGADGWPTALLDRLEGRDRLAVLADDLAALADRGGPR